MTTLSVFVEVYIWVLGFYKVKAHGSWTPMSFAIWIVAKLLCSLVFVSLDAIIKLHAMNERMFNGFLVGK